MEILALIEPIAGRGFRARVGSPFDLTAEGPTREAAVDRLHQQIDERIKSGWVLVPIELSGLAVSAIPLPGDLRDDSLLQDWLEAMSEYRDRVDAAESVESVP